MVSKKKKNNPCVGGVNGFNTMNTAFKSACLMNGAYSTMSCGAEVVGALYARTTKT